MRGRAAGIALFAVATAAVYWRIFLGWAYAARDVWRIAIPDTYLIREALLDLEVPLWNPHQFLGQPLLGTLQAQALYPPRMVAALLFGPVWGPTAQQLFHVAVAATGAFALAGALRASRPGRWFAAAAFALSPLFTEAGLAFNVHGAVAWTGWIAWCALRLDRERCLRHLAALAGAIALSFSCGAPEIVLGQLLLAAALVRWRSLPWVGLGGAWALALSAAVALPTLEFAAHSLRARAVDGGMAWSTSWIQLLAFFWPHADEPRRGYFFTEQWLLVDLFVGSTTFLLAMVALRRRRRVVALAGAGVLFALVALGSHFPPSEAVLSWPPLDRFRFPAKALPLVGFCLAILAGLGVSRLRVLARRVNRAGWGPRLLALSMALAVLLIALGTLGRTGTRAGAPWLSAMVLAVATVAVRADRFLGARLVALLSIELCAYHLGFVGYGWANARRISVPAPFAEEVRDRRFSVDRGTYFSALGEPEVVEYTLGRDAQAEESRQTWLPNRHVEDRAYALEGYGAPEPARVDRFHFGRARGIFDAASVTYFVRSGPPPFPDLVPVAQLPQGATLYFSETAMPRVYLVHRAEVVSDEEALARIASPDQPFRHTAFLADGPTLRGRCSDRASLLPRSADGHDPLSYAAFRHRVWFWVTTGCPGVVVLTDAHYPGWRATVNGAEVPIHRANFALRAVAVPAGRSEVEFVYAPWSFRAGAIVSAAALALLAWAVRPRRPRT